MWLLIDDVRDCNCDVIARTATSWREMLRRGDWECVVFDHDLGHLTETGYDVLVWAIENGFLPPKVQLVTSNPVGLDRMRAALESEGYKATLDGRRFEAPNDGGKRNE